ncbi:13325_t:CDS:2 [Cetraspora pellucida]|uniref:13325_t:CDS:1 n=1 Tax=Cetraspora pellucida TaxID=1433469 RepID=A0A9N8Z483_9GLOM|nr:13325_t:CDS:2 [Cetraspora pellucida]
MPPRLIIVTSPRPTIITPSRLAKLEKIKHINNYLYSNILFKLDNSTYDPLEDDNYNIDEGRPLNNLLRENLEKEEKNVDNDYRNLDK